MTKKVDFFRVIKDDKEYSYEDIITALSTASQTFTEAEQKLKLARNIAKGLAVEAGLYFDNFILTKDCLNVLIEHSMMKAFSLNEFEPFKFKDMTDDVYHIFAKEDKREDITFSWEYINGNTTYTIFVSSIDVDGLYFTSGDAYITKFDKEKGELLRFDPKHNWKEMYKYDASKWNHVKPTEEKKDGDI